MDACTFYVLKGRKDPDGIGSFPADSDDGEFEATGIDPTMRFGSIVGFTSLEPTLRIQQSWSS